MKYNVSDIIDFEVISTFQQFSLITFILTLIFEIFYGFIVYLSTSKKMQSFRILTFFYIFECILAEFSLLCWKPFMLFPFTIFYPTGILAPMSSTLSGILAAAFPFWHACFVETFAIIIVERHFLIIGNSTKFKNARFWVYFFMVLTLFCTTVPFFTFVLQNFDDEKAQNILKLEIENVEQILVLQPSLYYLNCTINISLEICIFFGGIYGIYHLLLLGYILKENYNFVKNRQSVSERTRKQFSIMLQSTVTQLSTTLFFGSFAGIWCCTFWIGQNTVLIKYVYYISLSMVICYPIADVIVVLSVVKGYRNTIKKLFNVVTKKTKERFSGFQFRNNAVYNQRNNSLVGSRKPSIVVF